ncbi:N-acylneuraminate-9-phosphatase [Merluccius polli]|uniref:N-acylneuraminate-9-phosphatase n=1 Tax=Merluccius polli TaxID=89951 RepID=A0AA47MCA7_MERPO|nr:N-acylneuraminate-9-phosphatase [Merluccius polli]
MDRKPIEAILFDLDNTLIQTTQAGRVALEKTGDLLRKTPPCFDDVTIGHITDKFNAKLLRESFDAAAGGTIDEVRVGHWLQSIREEAAGVCADACTRSLAAACYGVWKSSRLELLSLSPETRALLAELRTRYKLLLLTNGESQTQWEKVAAARCEPLFDAVVVGGDHAEQKPALSIFRHCFSMLGVEAGRCVMVGDSLDTDILGGAGAGVRATVWVQDPGAPRDRTGTAEPDYTVATVLDLPGVLARIERGNVDLV